MCELFCLSSHLSTRATFSLRTFARHRAPGAIPVDGWGIALYDSSDVRLYKEPEPAGDSAWLRFVEGRHLASRLLVSHIRHATTGDISLANTQPFVRELGGRQHVFAHNGKLDAISDRSRATLLRFCPIGKTDSEQAFACCSSAWRPYGPARPSRDCHGGSMS
jgi:predicted glutamine amidotransferase